MLSIAAEDYLNELLDTDTLERSKILNVFMTEELISRKDRFVFEDTTYVIGTLTRNRLLGKKQSRNESFVSNVIYVEMGQLNILIDAILAKEEEEGGDVDVEYDDEEYIGEDTGSEDIQGFSVFIDDPDGSDNFDDDDMSAQEDIVNEDFEQEDNNDDDIRQEQLVCSLGVPLVTIHYIPRKNLNILTESSVAGPISYTMIEVQQKVREYFEH